MRVQGDAPSAQFSRTLLYMVPVFRSRLMGNSSTHLLDGEWQRGAVVVDLETQSSGEPEAATVWSRLRRGSAA